MNGENMSHCNQTLSIHQNNVSFFFNYICKNTCDNHIVLPPIKAPSLLFLQKVGKDKLTKLFLHHYGLMRQMASFAFYSHEYQTFMEETTKIAHFMIEAFGCNNLYTKEYGARAMRELALPFNLNENARELWLKLLAQTLKDVDFPKDMLAPFWEWMELFSLRLLDTNTLKHLPKRYYYQSIEPSFH